MAMIGNILRDPKSIPFTPTQFMYKPAPLSQEVEVEIQDWRRFKEYSKQWTIALGGKINKNVSS